MIAAARLLRQSQGEVLRRSGLPVLVRPTAKSSTTSIAMAKGGSR